MKNKLSIIIPCYNIISLPKERFENVQKILINNKLVEVILVNDGSTDKTLPFLEKMFSDFSNAKVISQKNKGLSGARLFGLKNVSENATHIIFKDADDDLSPHIDDSLKKLSKDEYGYFKKITYIKNDVHTPSNRIDNMNLADVYTNKNSVFLGIIPIDLAHKMPFENILFEDVQFIVWAYENSVGLKIRKIDIETFVYHGSNSLSRSTNDKVISDKIIKCHEAWNILWNKIKNKKLISKHDYIFLVIKCLTEIYTVGNSIKSSDIKKVITQTMKQNGNHFVKRDSALSLPFSYRVFYLLLKLRVFWICSFLLKFKR